MYRTHHIVRLNFGKLYSQGTFPEGELYTFDKSSGDSEFDEPGHESNWKLAHWHEVIDILKEKHSLSQAKSANCGLLTAVFAFFQSNPGRLFGLMRDYKTSLFELSLIVSEAGEKRLVMPNIQRSAAHEGRLEQYSTVESFLRSQTGFSLAIIAQKTASRAEEPKEMAAKDHRLRDWIRAHAKEARKRLEANVAIEPGLNYIHMPSPDVLFSDLGHLPIEEIASELVFESTLEETIAKSWVV